MKINLNYFTSGTLVKIINGVINILTVLYFDHSDHKRKEAVRLPGGTFQFIDLLNALEEVALRIGLPLDKKLWLEEEIRKISASNEATIAKMPSKNNYEKFAIREVFLKNIDKAEENIESLVYGSEKLRILENACKEQTLRRELREECTTLNCSTPIECGFIKRGEHVQIPFLVLESDTPDEYNGSSDPDIKESKYIPIEEVKKSLYRNHEPFFNNTLSQLAHIWTHDKNKSSLVDQINKCLGGVNV